MKTIKTFSFRLFLLSLFAAICVLSSCLKDRNQEYIPSAGVLFINAIPQAYSLIVLLDQNKITNQSMFTYGTYLNYINAFTGDRKLTAYINHQGQSATMIDTLIRLQDKQTYSVVFFETMDTTTTLTLKDSSTNLTGNEAGVRFFHFAKGYGPLSLRIAEKSTSLFLERAQETALSATEGSLFLAKEGGVFSLELVDRTETVLASRNQVNLSPKNHYTIIAKGNAGNKTSFPLEIGIIQH